MNLEIQELELDLWQHSKGELCDMGQFYSTERGNIIATAGANGSIQICKMGINGEVVQKLEHSIDEEISAVAISPDGKEVAYAIMGSQFIVQLLNIQDGEDGNIKVLEPEDSHLIRFTSPVRALDYSPDGTRIACGSEAEVQVVSRGDRVKTARAIGHDGGVRALAFDPAGALLASMGYDGYLRLFTVARDLEEGGAVKEVHARDLGLRAAPTPAAAHPAPRPAWHPRGARLALPGRRGLHLLARDPRSGRWELDVRLAAAAGAEGGGPEGVHREPLMALAFSPSGQYLAAAGKDGRVAVWDWEAADPVPGALRRLGEGTSAGRLLWLRGPGANALAVQGLNSQFGVFKDAIPLSKGYAPPTADPSQPSTSPEKSPLKNKGPSAAPEEETNVFDGANPTQSVEEIKKSMLIDSAAAEAGDEDSEAEEGFEGEEGEGEEGAAPAPPLPPAEAVYHAPAAADPQGPFQVAATPLAAAAAAAGGRRFLAWNAAGSITSMDQETHNSIQIEYNDRSSSRRNHRFVDNYGFSLGALGENGAVFATSNEDLDPEETQRRFHLHYVNTTSRSGESWNKILPSKEEPVCVATGEDWAAVATANQNIRLFSVGGLQLEIFSIPGPIVTLIGSKQLLAVFYHQAPPLLNSQNLAFQLLKIDSQEEIASGKVGFSPDTTLRWAGFSDSLLLSIMDSKANLFSLTKSFGWSWKPSLDGSKAVNGNGKLWPISVTDRKLFGVLLKNGSEYPNVHPLPRKSAYPLKIPLLQADTELLTTAEQEILMGKRLLCQKKVYSALNCYSEDVDEVEQSIIGSEIQLDKTLIRAFQEACDSEDPEFERALDLAKSMYNEKSLDIALRLANHHGHSQLVKRIQHIIEMKFYQDEEEEASDDESDQEDVCQRFQPRANPETNRTLDSMEKPRHQSSTTEALPPSTEQVEDETEESEQIDVPPVMVQPSTPSSSLKQEREANEVPVSNKENRPAQSAINPFSKKVFKSPLKRKKTVFDSMSEVVTSPSPKKLFNRQSSFAAEARTKRKHDKNVL